MDCDFVYYCCQLTTCLFFKQCVLCEKFDNLIMRVTSLLARVYVVVEEE
jgi:hypothetical protein